MADNEKSLFKRLTQLFRSGPAVNRSVKKYKSITKNSPFDSFKRNQSGVYSHTMSAYGSYDRSARYADFSEMEYMPELASALDIYADEMTTHSNLQPMLNIKCRNDEIKAVLNILYHNVMNIEHNLFGWCRTMCKYGDFILYLDIDDEMGVQSTIAIPLQEVERLEEDYRKDLDENMVKTQEGLTEKVDNYLNYVVEEWTKENELAIERGLKGEIAEDFISGLKQLFEDHYIDVPDEKYDILEAQSQKISELEAKLNEEVEKNIGFKNNNAKLVREQVISQCTGDLTEVEIEKFKSLTEDVDFTDENSFRSKLDTLKESYFPKNKQVVTETNDDVAVSYTHLTLPTNREV